MKNQNINQFNYCLLYIILIIILLVILLTFIRHKNKSRESFYNLKKHRYNIILYTNDTSNLNVENKKLLDKISKLNPESKIYLFNRSDLDIFIQKYFDNYKLIINNFNFDQSKINLSLYLICYKLGGIFLDFNTDIFKSFKDLDFNKVIFPLQFTNIENLVLKPQGFQILLGNYFYHTPPGHPFMKKLIDNISNNNITIFQHFNYERIIFYTSGPVIITQTYIDYEPKDQILILSKKPFKESYIGDYGKFLKILNLYTWAQTLYSSPPLKPYSYPAYQFNPEIVNSFC